MTEAESILICAIRYALGRRSYVVSEAVGWGAELPFDLIGKHDQMFRSQLEDILAGDGLPRVTVIDLRRF